MTLPEHLERISVFLQQEGANLFQQACLPKEIATLSLVQVQYLELIAQRPGITPTQLAAEFCVRKPTVTNVLNQLVTRRLILKQQDAQDRRMMRLRISQHAQDFFDFRHSTYRRFAERIEESLSDNEIETLIALFEKIVLPSPSEQGSQITQEQEML